MKVSLYLIAILYLAQGCVGTDTIDDLVPEKIEITNPLISLKVGESYNLMYRYLNNVAEPETKEVRWETNNASVLTINEHGELTALDYGQAEISVILEENNQVMEGITVVASDQTVLLVSGGKFGTIASTSSYELKGDFEMSNIDGGVEISIADNYVASEALPGLYVYLSNNPTTVSGALEIGEVKVFLGTHSYNVTADDLTVDTYAYLLYFCKPFNVKVGHGEILD
ncbi:Ig-like domain (group 2) [Reichenbachiella faecimaris]|uniref:Ig-like domain (Group 2) n=1 Tax=Reichenbachiella faecimaris TaxID=692418 RepID=A0A1W2GR63_REIFA|nr:Ig-like domain-containing protein [Reichenbachiella faecimaris]SMD39044.1 Ig-like domain (group 2) [Reichenbachiella faecimaris]